MVLLLRTAPGSRVTAGCLILLFCGAQGGLAGTEPGTTAADAANPPPSGNFFTSVKQAFSQDLDTEVVRGHFNVGSPPDSHRYYCLIDPKTGKREINGVGGQPFVRRDGMTGIKSGAVSFFSCVEAERQGILVTTDYFLSPGAKALVTTAPVPAPAPTPAPVQRPEPALTTVAVDETAQADLKAVYAHFIEGQNAHDPAMVSGTLLDSQDFVWAQSGGTTIWGRAKAMEAFQDDWKGTWKLEPQIQELRLASIAPGVAILITPALFTQGAAGEVAAAIPIRWGGVFVKTPAGWRISSIFITPFKN